MNKWNELSLLLEKDRFRMYDGRRGEKLFELLYAEIRYKHPEDGIAIINTTTEEWKWASTLAEAVEIGKEMKPPQTNYFRPCYNLEGLQ